MIFANSHFWVVNFFWPFKKRKVFPLRLSNAGPRRTQITSCRFRKYLNDWTGVQSKKLVHSRNGVALFGQAVSYLIVGEECSFLENVGWEIFLFGYICEIFDRVQERRNMLECPLVRPNLGRSPFQPETKSSRLIH